MLEVVGINKKFKDTTALNNINLSFGEKGLVAILGESGSGKSTLFNILTGVVKPDSGQVIYDGIPLNTDGKINSHNIFGIIFQDGNLLGGLTVKQNLDICSADTQRQIEILQNLGIKKYIDTKVSKLSGGEMQRVAIARALLDDSKILLADEPTGSLDEKNGENVMSILKDISSQKLVLVITHNVEFANKYADRIIKIYKGDIQEDSKPYSDNSLSDDKIKDNINNKADLQQNIADKPRQLTFSSLNKFCFAKLKNTLVKNLTSIFILTIMFLLIAIPSAILMTDCRKEYIKSIEDFEYSALYNDNDMNVFAQKLEDGNMQGLTRYYNYKWEKGKSIYIIVDDSLKDNEIKIGYATANTLNKTLISPLKAGDTINYHDKDFVVTNIEKEIKWGYGFDLNSAVYLNNKMAQAIILAPKLELFDGKYRLLLDIKQDNSLKDGECRLGFGLYYALGSRDNNYIDLKKDKIVWQFSDINTVLYSQEYTIINVDDSTQDVEDHSLYVSPADYKAISESRLYYGYYFKTADKETMNYWLDRNVEIFNQDFESYLKAKSSYQAILPFAVIALVIGIVLTALYMLSLLSHIVAMNTRELYILKTLRIGHKSIFGILVLQALPVVLCANIITLITNIVSKVLIEKKILFFVLQVAGSNILLLTLSLIIAILITVIKMHILNKNFNINLTR